MLLRNLKPKKVLCNGTRLIGEDLPNNFIKVKILTESKQNDFVYIPRIDLVPSDIQLPFILRRKQLPFNTTYPVTINTLRDIRVSMLEYIWNAR